MKFKSSLVYNFQVGSFPSKWSKHSVSNIGYAMVLKLDSTLNIFGIQNSGAATWGSVQDPDPHLEMWGLVQDPDPHLEHFTLPSSFLVTPLIFYLQIDKIFTNLKNSYRLTALILIFQFVEYPLTP